MKVIPLAALAALSILNPLHAQTVEELVARGDSLYDALRPAQALEAYRQAFNREPYNAEVAYKFSRAQIDVAKQLQGNNQEETRDSLYWVAQLYGRRAIESDSSMANGYFILANALGRLSRTRGGRERVQYAGEIYDLASRALELDPDHDGAHHVLGAWHAEIRRLSGLTRLVARTLLGADFMSSAAWDSAAAHLERSVEIRPEYLYHRLELAQVYRDMEQPQRARQQLQRLLELPPTSDVMDRHYKEEAREMLSELQ